MMKIATLAVLSLMLISGEPDWKLEKDSDGIKVYLAKAENSSIKQFKVEAFIEATPKEIVDAVVDIENNHKWFVSVEKGKLVERISPNEFIFSQVIEVPFPFQDRQVVQNTKVTNLENGVLRIDLNSVSDALEVDNDYVRMTLATGYWVLTPTSEGTDLEYSFLADPAGNIPAWLANQFIVDNPLKTIKGLREYIDD
mgnify:FL=1|jgi:hypothetical protein